MNQRELRTMTTQELGHEYWRVCKVVATHPQKSLASRAAQTARIILEAFQSRLLNGDNHCIDDFKKKG